MMWIFDPSIDTGDLPKHEQVERRLTQGTVLFALLATSILPLLQSRLDPKQTYEDEFTRPKECLSGGPFDERKGAKLELMPNNGYGNEYLKITRDAADSTDPSASLLFEVELYSVFDRPTLIGKAGFTATYLAGLPIHCPDQPTPDSPS